MAGCEWSLCQETSHDNNTQIHCVLGNCFADTEFLIGPNVRSAVTFLTLLKKLIL